MPSTLEIPVDHPIWKHLWMRREDLSRVDFDDEPDVENREACRDIFDTLEVELSGSHPLRRRSARRDRRGAQALRRDRLRLR